MEEEITAKKRNAGDAFESSTAATTDKEEENDEVKMEEVTEKEEGTNEDDDVNENEEKICRFCFCGDEDDDDDDDDGNNNNKNNDKLIAPCGCKGGQKYIHLSCLRQWQRMVLISQPTHPDFWEDDIRHRKCNVCKKDFTCEPPTRQELMEGFTGPEIAALIEPGCIIGSHEGFNRTLEEHIRDNPLAALLSSVQHWLRGVYLITKVQEDTGEIEYPVTDYDDVHRLLSRLDDDELCLETHDGTKYKLEPEGVLTGVAFPITKKDLKSMLSITQIPCHFVFRPVIPKNNVCSDDKVAAINLTRPFQPRNELARLCQRIIKETKTRDVDVTYYQGGPCDDDNIVCCLVLGGRRNGYTVVNRDFKKALLFAKRNAKDAKKEGRNDIAVGQDVVLQGLCKRPDLNGKRGLVQAFSEKEKRFEVRLLEQQQQQAGGGGGGGKAEGNDTDADCQQKQENNTVTASSASAVVVVKVKPENIVGHSSGIGKNGKVLAFVGDARWTRAQLLGEIAKTSWGLCQSQLSDLFIEPKQLYGNVFDRLVYAPLSEMSEEYARDNMVALRRGAMEAAQYVANDNDQENSDSRGGGE